MLKQAFAASLLLAIVVSLASAQVVGTSKLTLSSSVIYVHQGNSTDLTGSVALVNGTASGSTLTVVNSKNLSAEGITVYLPNGYGVPPYSPRITVSANATTAVGNYTIVFYEAGDDQALNNTPATLVVLSPSTPLPSTTATSTEGTSTIPVNGTNSTVSSIATTVPTTVSGTPPPGIFANQEYIYLLIAAIVVVIIIIVAVVAYQRKR